MDDLLDSYSGLTLKGLHQKSLQEQHGWCEVVFYDLMLVTQPYPCPIMASERKSSNLNSSRLAG